MSSTTAMRAAHQRIVRDLGLCGELVDGGESVCIVKRDECERHSPVVRDQHHLRRFKVNGSRPMPFTKELDHVLVTETVDGGEIAAVGRSTGAVVLDATALADLARQLTAWFMDDPTELVAQAQASIADIKECLTNYNAEADRMGGDFEPFARLYNQTEAIGYRLSELAKVFSAVKGSAGK